MAQKVLCLPMIIIMLMRMKIVLVCFNLHHRNSLWKIQQEYERGKASSTVELAYSIHIYIYIYICITPMNGNKIRRYNNCLQKVVNLSHRTWLSFTNPIWIHSWHRHSAATFLKYRAGIHINADATQLTSVLCVLQLLLRLSQYTLGF
jgi:hypothetical protein